MKALAFAGALALLMVAFYVAFSDAGREFGIWGIALTVACGIVLIRKPTGPWGRVSLVGLVIGTAAFAGYASRVLS